MTATVDAVVTSVQGDGGRDGKGFTSGASMTGKRVLVLVTSSSNADTISAPGSGTWAEVSLPDNLVTTSGGQYRLFEGSSLANSTNYDFTLSGGRRTLVARTISGFDATSGSMVDVASSLESAAGATHAPPSVIPGASNELCVDYLAFRQFAPDTSTGSPPSTGLSWTEDVDVRGADSNNNMQVNSAFATAGAAGVAVSTAAWNTDDPFEPALVIRVLIKSAAAAGASPTGLAVPVALGSPSTSIPSTAPTGLAVPVGIGAPAVSIPSTAPAGLAVPLALGSPSTAIPSTAPAGLAIPIAFGAPTVGLPGAAPAGLAVPVALGAPAAELGRTARPAGLAVPVALGAPSVLDEPVVEHRTAVLTPSAAALPTLTPGAGAAATLTASAISAATLTPGSA